MHCPFNCAPILWPIAFFILNVAILRVILWRSGKKDRPRHIKKKEIIGSTSLDPSEILGWEFGYAQTTASEAMQDRHTMINYYLIIVAVVSTGVIAVLGQDKAKVAIALPIASGAILLWLLASIGSFYFLKIASLRRAWYLSVLAMIQIKEFYIRYSNGMNGDTLREAFFFEPETLPARNKRWNVFFYSAMLVAFLNGVSYMAGGMLIVASNTLANSVIQTRVTESVINGVKTTVTEVVQNNGNGMGQFLNPETITVFALGILLFIFYGILYNKFLK